MKNYVVGILSMFENDLKLFKVVAENEYEAVKKGMVEFTDNPESKQHEIDWQNSSDYPTDLEGLYSVYEEVPFAVVEVGSFEVSLSEIRQAVAAYILSEGCSCCRSYNHDENGERLAVLLGVKKYEDGSGYDWESVRK